MDEEKNGVAETERVSVGLDRQVDKLEARRAAKEGQRAAGKLAGQRARGATEKLLTRTTSGAIYALLIVACLFIGPFTTTLLVVCMAWLCCSEFFRTTSNGRSHAQRDLWSYRRDSLSASRFFRGVAGLAVLLLLFLVAIAAWYVATPRAGIGDVAVSVFGPIYTSFAFSAIVLVRVSDKGFTARFLPWG